MTSNKQKSLAIAILIVGFIMLTGVVMSILYLHSYAVNDYSDHLIFGLLWLAVAFMTGELLFRVLMMRYIENMKV